MVREELVVRLVLLVLILRYPHLAEGAEAVVHQERTAQAAAGEVRHPLVNLGQVAPQAKAATQPLAAWLELRPWQAVAHMDSILEMDTAQSLEVLAERRLEILVAVPYSVAVAVAQLGVRGASIPMEAAVPLAVMAQALLLGLLVRPVAMVAVMRLAREVAVVLGQVAPQMEAQAEVLAEAEGQAAAMMEALGQAGLGESAVLAQLESFHGR